MFAFAIRILEDSLPRRRTPTTALRKAPKQARSTQLVDAILQAAIRVLEREGAAAFTTVRVAEKAGVSVGSLYQYFPNKASILFRLQQEEWEATGRLLEGIFDDERLDAAQRLRVALQAFFRTEHEERPLRRALGDAAPLYRDAPRAREQRERVVPLLKALIAKEAPSLSPRQRASATDMYIALLSAMGEHVSENAESRAEVDRWSAATADMFLAWLKAQAR
jgi:AcrR family transcriptional regulator